MCLRRHFQGRQALSLLLQPRITVNVGELPAFLPKKQDKWLDKYIVIDYSFYCEVYGLQVNQGLFINHKPRGRFHYRPPDVQAAKKVCEKQA